MTTPHSSQTTLKGYALRPYEDHWHGSSWDEAVEPQTLPSLMQVLRGFFARRPR